MRNEQIYIHASAFIYDSTQIQEAHRAASFRIGEDLSVHFMEDAKLAYVKLRDFCQGQLTRLAEEEMPTPSNGDGPETETR